MRKTKPNAIANLSDDDREGWSDEDYIIQAITNPDFNEELNDRRAKLLDRCRTIDNLRTRENKTTNYLIGHLVAKYGISRSQAYKDIASMYRIFGETGKLDKNYELRYLKEKSYQNIAIAFATNDSKLITKALLAHRTITGQDKDELPFDMSKIEPSTIVFNIDPTTTALIQLLLSKGSVNLNDLIPFTDFELVQQDAK